MKCPDLITAEVSNIVEGLSHESFSKMRFRIRGYPAWQLSPISLPPTPRPAPGSRPSVAIGTVPATGLTESSRPAPIRRSLTSKESPATSTSSRSISIPRSPAGGAWSRYGCGAVIARPRRPASFPSSKDTGHHPWPLRIARTARVWWSYASFTAARSPSCSILRTLSAGRRLNSGSRQRDARRSRARGNQKFALTQHQPQLRRPPAVANRLRISTKEFGALEIPRHRRWFRLAEPPAKQPSLPKRRQTTFFHNNW